MCMHAELLVQQQCPDNCNYSWFTLKDKCRSENWEVYLYGDMIISSNHDICPDNYNYSRFTLKDKCRSEKWEVCLYGDMPVFLRQGMESSRAENCGGLRSCSSWCDGLHF